jgi:hypothetical protein
MVLWTVAFRHDTYDLYYNRNIIINKMPSQNYTTLHIFTCFRSRQFGLIQGSNLIKAMALGALLNGFGALTDTRVPGRTHKKMEASTVNSAEHVFWISSLI